MKKFKSGDRIIVTAEHIQSYEQIGTINYYSSSTSCKIRFDNWNGLGRKKLVIKEIYLERYEDNMAAVKGNYKVAMVKFLEGVKPQRIMHLHYSMILSKRMIVSWLIQQEVFL